MLKVFFRHTMLACFTIAGLTSQSFAQQGNTKNQTGNNAQKNVVNTQPAQKPVAQAQQTAPPRIWSVTGVYGEIVAADCRDCGEDIGLMLACQGEGLSARMSVPWVAIENGFDGSVLPIEISIGNQQFSYRSTLNEWGMVGFVPEFIVSPNDLIVQALQSGYVARFEFEGISTDVSLRGSYDALEIFKAHCGWNNVPLTQVANDNSTEIVPSSDPFAVWFASQHDDFDTGRQISTLTYGIPETDATGFYASCEPDGSVQTSLIVDFGDLANTTPVEAFIQTDQLSHRYQGEVFIDPSGEWAGIGMRMNTTDPIWQAMQSSRQVAFGILDGAQVVTSSQGASQAIAEFIGNCRS